MNSERYEVVFVLWGVTFTSDPQSERTADGILMRIADLGIESGFKRVESDQND